MCKAVYLPIGHATGTSEDTFIHTGELVKGSAFDPTKPEYNASPLVIASGMGRLADVEYSQDFVLASTSGRQQDLKYKAD